MRVGPAQHRAAAHAAGLEAERGQPDLLPPPRDFGILGGATLTFAELDRRFAAGAQITCTSTSHSADGAVALFAVTPDGHLRVTADGHPPDVRPGDSVIILSS